MNAVKKVDNNDSFFTGFKETTGPAFEVNLLTPQFSDTCQCSSVSCFCAGSFHSFVHGFLLWRCSFLFVSF